MARNTASLKPLLGSLDQDSYLLDGYVTINSSAAVVAEDMAGMTVAKTGTGEYTFTFAEKPARVRYAACTYVNGTATDLVAQVKSYTTTSVVVRLNTGATATDPTTACGLLFFAVVSRAKSTR